MNEDKFVIWRGQIVDDTVWKDNLPAKKWQNSKDIPGWGTRYKVRIIGRDTETKDVPDDLLEMATVLYPVTAGSGHGGSYQTSNLRKGSFVWGFYDDPDAKAGPVILGCLGNHEQIQLSRTIPVSGLDPFSGYIRENVSYTDIPAEGSGQVAPLEGSSNQLQNNIADQQQKEKGQQETPLPVSSDCDKIQLGAIQVEIKKFIQDLQNFKNQATSWKNTILRPIKENGQDYSVEEYIAYKIQNVSEWISGKMKNIITEIQAYIERKINAGMKDTYDLLFPDQRATAKAAVETANDLIACLFRKIISNLLGIVKNFLLQIAERFINAPLCAIENIVGALLGKLTGLISSGIQAIMAPVNAILGVVDLAGDIVGFIIDVISFLACEETPACPGVTSWSPWDGSAKFNLGSNIAGIVDKVKTYASTVQQSVDPDNFNFDLDFSDIFQDTCNVGPIFCGPPTVEFYGGGGSGAAGNVIVSATGSILGVDLTSSGSGYTSAPLVKFVDACGKGQGASARSILGTAVIGSSGSNNSGGGANNSGSGTGGGGANNSGGGAGGSGAGGSGAGGGGAGGSGVARVVIEDNGTGYLPTPNGDQGGDGRTFSTADQSIIKREDGTYDRPYNPGEIVPVNTGDTIYSCGNEVVVEQVGNITIPKCPSTKIPNQSQYNIILELEDIVIENPGVNYDCAVDTIKITPDHGAKLRYSCNSFGSLTKVEVIKTGIGFTESPTIEIETKTGFNAKLLPVFRVNSNVELVRDLTEIISVVDCVGKT